MILTKGNKKRRRIAAVGMYDGVHRGHRFLLDYLKLEASQRGLTPTAVTFRDHPLTIVRPDEAPLLLCSPDEKLRLLTEAGVEDIVILDFNDKMRHFSARRFLSMLHKRWAIDTLIVGFNNRFGHDRVDGIEQYRAIGDEIGIDIIEAPEYKGIASPVSSSIIRSMLGRGDVKGAAEALGHPYILRGTVVDGRHLGRSLGFPTANLSPEPANSIVPAPGVYVAEAVIPSGEILPAVVNIGHRPTVEDDPEQAPLSIEAHIIDWSGYLYGEHLELNFIGRLRDEKKFDSLDRLRQALRTDCRHALDLLKKRK